MTSLLKHKKVQHTVLKRMLSVSLFALPFAFLFYFWSGYFDSFFLKIAVPISTAISKSAKNLELALKLLEPEATLISQNEILRRRVIELESKTLDYEIISNENIELQRQLEFKSPDHKIANVLLAPPQTPFDTIVIDRGSADNIKAGDRVLSSERTVLGFIEKVFNRSSQVRMYSSSGIKTTAIFQKDGTIIDLLGVGGSNFIFEAPIGFDVVQGDIFTLPGSKKLVVAVVGRVEQKETSSFVKVFLKSPIEIRGNTILFVEI